MKTQFHTLTLITLICLLGTFTAEARIFTSTDGKTIEGELVNILGENAVIKMGTQTHHVPKSRFSKADLKYFAQWEKREAENRIPRVDVTISTGKTSREDRNDSYDDRSGSVAFKVSVENNESDFEIKGAKGTLVVIGRDVENDDYHNIYQKVEVDINIEAGKTWEWRAKEVKYTFDDRTPTLWGFEYYGYVFQIKNAAGNVIFTKSLPKRIESVTEEVLALKQDDQVNKAFIKIKSKRYVSRK